MAGATTEVGAEAVVVLLLGVVAIDELSTIMCFGLARVSFWDLEEDALLKLVFLS